MISVRQLTNWIAAALLLLGPIAHAETAVDFGDDAGSRAYDGSCQDPRFEGQGTAVDGTDEHRAHDATDCRVLFNQGSIALRSASKQRPLGAAASSGIDFGDDASMWANDGECDDPRFHGAGAAATLLEEDRYHDATDCRDLFNLGHIGMHGEADAADAPVVPADQIDFGDNSSAWASDGECDDPRFRGAGAAELLAHEDLLRDAKDCRLLYERGSITLDPGYTPPTVLYPGAEAEGRLEASDATLKSGEYSDTYFFEGVAHEYVTIDLRSTDFDPYLIIRSPSGEQMENDDNEDDAAWSMLSFRLPEGGRYTVLVTSYEPGEAGAYTIAMRSLTALL